MVIDEVTSMDNDNFGAHLLGAFSPTVMPFEKIFHSSPQVKPLMLSHFSHVPTLCDPIDGSPPGSPIPEILQARILAWVAISFSNACK